MNPGLAAVFILLALIGLAVIIAYNKLVGLRLRIDESWSNVDTELKRRHELIPNLVNTVKGYTDHERTLLIEVARVRALAQTGEDTAERRAGEAALASSAQRAIAVAVEAYPELRAQANFLQLQKELVMTEDRIQAARRFFNGNVRDHNNMVEQFPSNLVARSFGFTTRPYFDLPVVAERMAPAVSL